LSTKEAFEKLLHDGNINQVQHEVIFPKDQTAPDENAIDFTLWLTIAVHATSEVTESESGVSGDYSDESVPQLSENESAVPSPSNEEQKTMTESWKSDAKQLDAAWRKLAEPGDDVLKYNWNALSDETAAALKRFKADVNEINLFKSRKVHLPTELAVNIASSFIAHVLTG